MICQHREAAGTGTSSAGFMPVQGSSLMGNASLAADGQNVALLVPYEQPGDLAQRLLNSG